MAKGFYKNLIKVLKANGCYFVRSGKGDHEIWYSPLSDKNFPVDKIVKSRHLANVVLKQAGIDHKF